MNVCDPNTSYEDIKKRVERNVGRPLNMSRKQLCELYTNIQQDRLLSPPLVMTTDRSYMLDRKSPFTQRNYEVLFDRSSKKSQLKRLATKVGALNNPNDTKEQIKYAIFAKLRSLGVREPVKLSKIPTLKKNTGVINLVNVNRNLNVTKNTRLNNANVNKNTRLNTNKNLNTNVNVNKNLNANVNVNKNLNLNVNANRNLNVNVNENRNLNVNENRNTGVPKRGTLFKPGFVPNFIKSRQQSSTASSPAPVAERVARKNNSTNARPIMRAMNAPSTQRNEPSVTSRPPPAPIFVERRAAPPVVAVNTRESQNATKKVAERKELQKHLNSLTNLSVEDVDEYVSRLQSNVASLKNLKNSSMKQNEVYRKRKEQIRQKLKNFEQQMTMTQKNIYEARLNSIPRGKTRSYLNNIESDILKDMNTSNVLRKRSQIRKEFVENGMNKEKLNAKYKELYNKYSGRNREALNKVYNSLKNMRPTIQTNANALTRMQVLQMLNKNKRQREERQISAEISQLTKAFNNAARSNAQSKMNNLQKQLMNAQRKRVASLEQELSQTKNLSRRISNPVEQVKMQNDIERLEQQLSTAESATSRVENEVTQIEQRAAKRRRQNTENSAAMNAANAAEARAAAAKANALAKSEERKRAEAELASMREMKTEAQREERQRKMEELEQKKKEERNAREAQRTANEQKRTEQRNAREAQRAANEQKRTEQRAANEQKRAEQRNAREAQRAANQELRNQQTNLLQRERQKRKELAREMEVDEAYVNRYVVGNLNNVNKNSMRAKVQKDKNLARLLKTRVKYIEPAKYNALLNKAKIDKIASNIGVNRSYVTEFMKNYQQLENNTNSMKLRTNLKNKITKDKVVAQLLGQSSVRFIKEENYNREMQRAQQIKNDKNLQQKIKSLAREGGVSTSYVMAYMAAQGKNTNVNKNAFKAKVNKDKQLAASEAKRGGLARRFLGNKVEYVPENAYNARAKQAANTKSLESFLKNTGIPKNFYNAHVAATGQNVNTLNKQNIVNKYAKAREISEFTKQPLKYPTNMNQLNKNLNVFRKKVSNDKLIEVLARNTKTTTDYVKKYITNAGMTLQNFVQNKNKQQEMKNKYRNEQEKAFAAKTGVPLGYLNQYKQAKGTKNVSLNNVAATYKKRQELERNEKTGKEFLNYLTNEQLNARTLRAQQQKGSERKLEKTRGLLRKRAKKVGLTNINLTNTNAAEAAIQSAQREKGAQLKLEQTRERLRKRAKKVGLTNINFTNTNAAEVVIQKAERDAERAQREKGAEQKLEQTRDRLRKRARKAGLANVNVTNTNAAEATIQKAERVQLEARKRGIKKLNSEFIQKALNMNNAQLSEAFIVRKLKGMGVNNAWIGAYKAERGVNVLTNDVFRTAERQLMMLKNEGGKNLVFLNKEGQLKKADALYLKSYITQVAKTYEISEDEAQETIRELLPVKNNTTKLRDAGVKRNIDAQIATKYKNKREFLNAKKTAQDTIQKMETSKLVTSKKNFIDAIAAATNKSTINKIMKNARKEYNTGKRVKVIPVVEDNSNSNEENAVVPYGPENTRTRRIGFRLGQFKNKVMQLAPSREKMPALPAPPQANMRKVLKQQAKARTAALPAPAQAKARTAALPVPANNKFVNAKDTFNNDTKSEYGNAQQNSPQFRNKRKPENNGQTRKAAKGDKGQRIVPTGKELVTVGTRKNVNLVAAWKLPPVKAKRPVPAQTSQNQAGMGVASLIKRFEKAGKAVEKAERRR